jgi:hypothetical protein
MFRLPLLALLLTAAGLAAPARAQAPMQQAAMPAATSTADARPYAAAITQDLLRRHLTVLASDAYEGRETGEKGQRLAAYYLAASFQALGLTGPVPGSDNPYLQHFTLERSAWPATGTLQVGRQRYQWQRDFYAAGSSPFDQATTLRPLFVGYGIAQEGYNDYAGLPSVKGRDLIMLLGEPQQAGKPLLSADGAPTKWGDGFRAKLALALNEKEARSVFFISASRRAFDQAQAQRQGFLSRPSISLPTTEANYAAAYFVSPAVGCQLLGTTEAALN